EKSINKTQHKVTVINPHSFKIGDTSIYSKYIRNGIARQVKTAKKVKFRKLEDCLFEKELFLDENLAISDFTKMSHSKPIHLAYHTLDVYSSLNNETPGLWNVKDCSKFMELANQVAEKFGYTLTEEDKKLITYFSFTNQT
ncbi:MAG: ubiquitin-activating E1 FCCH domain-containing protein, partial [Flammeovirgaceae bacterium]